MVLKKLGDKFKNSRNERFLSRCENKNFTKFCKKNKINQKALSLGFVFFVVFWIVFDSILFGVSLGFVMYIAFLEEDKENKNSKKSKIKKINSKKSESKK